jgi:hypothetical protein
MCPFCLASIGMIVAGATSAGGLTALAMKLSRKKNDAKEIPNPFSKASEPDLAPGRTRTADGAGQAQVHACS